MKKLSLISVAALMLASCSSEDVVPAGEGQEQQVTISLELPAEINSRATGAATSADGGLTNVTDKGLTFNVALYPKSGETLAETPVFVGTTTVSAGESVASFTPTVVLGKTYQVVAYASFDEGINWKESGVADVNVAQVINDEAEDAYFTNEELTAAASMKATLTRPYGKIRIIANDYNEVDNQFKSEISSITVTYKEGQATTFSPKAGNFGTETGGATFTANFATNYTDETGDAKTIVVDYVPATTTGEIVNIQSVTVTFKNEEVYTKDLSTLDIPVKRNCLTTLSGDFFTSDANLDLEVEDNLNQGDNINYEFDAAFANGGTVTLSEDITLDKLYTVAEGKTVVINLNGKSITSAPEGDIAFSVPATSKLIINGEGNVSTEKTLLYAAYGTLQINGGNHTAGLEVVEANGKNGGEGTAEINGGRFVANETYGGSYWTLNLKDNTGAQIIVKGGEFVGFNPAGGTTENPNQSFVAEGYVSTEINGVYYVTKQGVTPVATADALVAALEKGESVEFLNNIKIDPASMSSGYGTTGINVKNGQTIDGNGYTIDIKGAGGTWDSGINTTGGLIKDLTVTGSFRGIFINHNSTHSEPVVLENVTIDGTTYTVSCDQGKNQTLKATNSTFNGWTSFASTLGSAEFTNCNFGEGNGYAFCRPYAPTAFVGCAFEAGYKVDPVAAVTFENCTIGGVALTADNLATLVTSSNIANATVK